MGTFVLVHGPWHGGWCWERVAPLLRAPGHRVEVPDLPGHGLDQTPPSEISLRSYVDAVVRVVTEQLEPVVLVGHTKPGAVISEVAEKCPGLIAVLVYLAAYLLRRGETISDVGLTDQESLLVPNLVTYPTQSLITVRPEALRDVFYHDCDPATVAAATARIGPEPVPPITTPIRITPEHYGRVRRVYIETLQNRALGLALQRRMRAELPCEHVHSLDTGHTPFLSAPDALATCLLQTEASGVRRQASGVTKGVHRRVTKVECGAP